MKYRKPTAPAFWVPMPYTGQSRMDLIDWKFDETKEPQQMTLTDPDTATDYTVEILEIDGPFEMAQIPDKFGRQIINRDTTGLILSKLLINRMPEFKAANKVLFYLVNPLTNG